MKNQNWTASYAISFAVVSIVNGVLVVLKEENGSLKQMMKEFSGHHWITHGLLVIALFLLGGFLVDRLIDTSKWTPKQGKQQLVFGVAVGALIIAGFYLVH